MITIFSLFSLTLLHVSGDRQELSWIRTLVLVLHGEGDAPKNADSASSVTDPADGFYDVKA